MDIVETTIAEGKETIDGVTFGYDSSKSSIDVNGRVWIGDPCYPPFFNKYWNDGWLAAFWKCQKELKEAEAFEDSVVVTVNGIEMVAGGTSYGDGCYDVDGASGSCYVDAGLLCVIPEAMFELAGLDGENAEGGVYVDDVHGTAEVDEDNTIWAGSVKVITKERCENCNGIADECSCEQCWGCGEWDDWCTCEDTCSGCGMAESECCCDDEEDDDE